MPSVHVRSIESDIMQQILILRDRGSNADVAALDTAWAVYNTARGAYGTALTAYATAIAAATTVAQVVSADSTKTTAEQTFVNAEGAWSLAVKAFCDSFTTSP